MKSEKVKLKTVLLSLVVLVSMGCKQGANKGENANNTETDKVGSETVSGYIMDWANALNTNDFSALEQRYAANAVKVISVDSILESASQIATYYDNQKNKITAIESVFKVEANTDRRISYEVIKYKTEGQEEYLQLVIWRLENGQVIREFEFTERTSPDAKKVDTNEIADQRKIWLELCNAHETENLVKQLYSANTIYFNHKPIVQGFEDLITEYDYMNDPDYTLHLQPLKLEVVNANFAYEIGQCSGSYNGKYILIWKKLADGKWKIHIDSNI